MKPARTKRPAKGSPPSPAVATLQRKKKPAGGRVEAGAPADAFPSNCREFAREILSRIEGTQFDAEGFRLLTPEGIESRSREELSLCPPGARRDRLRDLLPEEMARECVWAYEFARDMLGGMAEGWPGALSPAEHRAKWPGDLCFVVHTLFPLSFWEISESESEVIEDFRSRGWVRGPAVEEILPGADDWIMPGMQRHVLRVEWGRGRDAVKKDLLAWMKKAFPANVRTRRGRNSAPDHLHALAAYRARRAGLDFEGFYKLISPHVKRWIYNDQPQFLRACRDAEKRLRKFDAEMREIVANHRKSNR